MSQTQISDKKGMTFASGLRSDLRQDPDVIMVGEIRDRETAGMAIQSALTGHLVFSTLHTNDAATAIRACSIWAPNPICWPVQLSGVLASDWFARFAQIAVWKSRPVPRIYAGSG